MKEAPDPTPGPAQKGAVQGVGSLILFCADLDACAAFYRRLGVALVEEDHGQGPVHWAADLGGTHFALFPGQPGPASPLGTPNPASPLGPAPPHKASGSQFFGLTVLDVEATLARALTAGAPLVEEARSFPWGRRALVQDPDGRVVELFEPPQTA